MKCKKLPNYITKYRKQTGFSQEEVAYLLGCRDMTGVSRYELFRREPSLRIALAFSIMFRVPAERLFAGDMQTVGEVVNRRAKHLLTRLRKGGRNQATMRKLAVLEYLAAWSGIAK